jgi:ribosomal protein L3
LRHAIEKVGGRGALGQQKRHAQRQQSDENKQRQAGRKKGNDVRRRKPFVFSGPPQAKKRAGNNPLAGVSEKTPKNGLPA